MSVYPEFLEYIHQVGMYVPGYNYEEMYNIMVYTLTYQMNPTNHFIYTPQFMIQLYNYLEELLDPVEMDTDAESNDPYEPPPILTNINQMNQTNQTALQAFNNYIITTLNNPNQMNQNNNLYNLNYNNLVYYTNT